MSRWSRYDAVRRKLHAQAPAGPVREYLEQPFPSRDSEALRVSMLALDLETAGLDAQTDDIVSMGWVTLEDRRVTLSSATERLVRPRGPLSASSVVIHGISDDQAATGGELGPAMEELLMALRGRVLLGHHIRMDASFLARACHNLGWGKVSFPCVDTLQLMQHSGRLRNETPASGQNTLSEARRRLGLPSYPAHSALWDAVAAAELWLVLGSEMAGRRGKLELGRAVHVWP